MKVSLHIAAAIILLIVIVASMMLSFNPPEWYCKVVGMGGISQVPANCVKYFIK